MVNPILNGWVMKLGYYLNEIKKNWRKKDWWEDRIKERIIKPLLWGRNNGFYVMDEDWNHLIILDACRYDVFEKEIRNWDLKGKLEKRISRGTNTPQFLLENFGNGHYDDIVYVTANPYVSYYLKGRFHKIIPVWDFGWDEKLKTVPPEKVYEATLKALRKYGNSKRLIIHFMQPHEPFITLKDVDVTGFRNARLEVITGKVGQIPDRCIWDLVREGKFDRKLAIEGYIENLRIVMPYVVKLCKILNGKVVVTSDHGEGFGERLFGILPIRIWGHPRGVRVRQLIEVPWFVCEGNERLNLDTIEKELIRLKSYKLLRSSS